MSFSTPPETCTALEANLRDNLGRALRRDSSWGSIYGEVFHLLRENAISAFLFGGTVRDVLLKGVTHRPRDLDIVFDVEGFDCFSSLFSKKIRRRNRFGGLKCSYKGVEIDAWPLHRTWAIAQGLKSGAGFEVLPETAFFNLDAIVAEIAPAQGLQRRIFDRGFFEGVARKQIECNFEPTNFPELNIIRGFVLARSTGFEFSNAFCRFIVEHLDGVTANEIETCQLEHYRRIRLPPDFIRTTVEQIKVSLARLPEGAFPITFPPSPRAAQLRFEMDPDPKWLAFTSPEDVSSQAEEPKHLFISYASEDERLATWLARKLSARGHPVWFDRLKLLGGEPWPQTIDDAIKSNTFRMLALMSRHSVKKPKATAERTLALSLGESLGIPDFLIPLKIDDCELDWLTSAVSCIAFHQSWADGWRALLKKLDSIGAERALAHAAPLAASTFPRGKDLLNRNGETLFTNLIPVKEFPQILRVCETSQTLAQHDWEWLNANWAFYRVSDDVLLTFKEPPPEFSDRIKMTQERCLWSDCEFFRNVRTKDVAARLIRSTLERKLQQAGCLPHPNPKLASTFYLPASHSDGGKLTFVGFTGRRTWLLIRGRVTFRRGPNAKEINFHNFAFRLRLARGIGRAFCIQITPTLVFFDEMDRPILDKSVGVRRRRMTKMWWNDKWLNRLLAAKHIISGLPTTHEGDVVLEPNLLTLSAPIGIREEVFDVDDGTQLNEEDIRDSEFILDVDEEGEIDE